MCTTSYVHIYTHEGRKDHILHTKPHEGWKEARKGEEGEKGRKQGRVRRGEKGRKKGRSFKRKMMNHTKKLSKVSILCRETAQKGCCHVLYGKAHKPELEFSSSNSFLKAKRASHILFFQMMKILGLFFSNRYA